MLIVLRVVMTSLATNNSFSVPSSSHTISFLLTGTAVSQQPLAVKNEDPSSGDKVLPDCPSDVSVQPNFSRGAYVLWSPVRY